MDDPDLRPMLPRRLRPGELVALDVLAAVGYTTVLFIPLLARPPVTPLPAALGWLVVAGIGLPLAVRRRWPRAVFGVVVANTVLATMLGLTSEPFIAAAFALYPVAVTVPRRRWEPTLAIGLVSAVGVIGLVAAGPAPGASQLPVTGLIGAVLLGAAWTIGRAVRERRVYLARYAEQLADRAATDERLRIARELHDVVSHTLSLIGVKAGIANHVADARPDEVRDALRVIETTSRDALAEMRTMLGVLRSDRALADLGPSPGLPGLPELVERAAAAGVQVDLDVRAPTPLPGGVELSVYRIVQEAVTNVIRHAAPARCRVVVDGTADEVLVEVIDDGDRTGDWGDRTSDNDRRPDNGHGLIGMRERALMHGGTFHAGPRPEGGFVVSARLPCRAPAANADPDQARMAP